MPIYGAGHMQVKESLRSAYTAFFEAPDKKSKSVAARTVPELAGRSKERRELRTAVGELAEEVQRPMAQIIDMYLRLKEETKQDWVGGSVLGQRLKEEQEDFALPAGQGKQLSKFLKKYPRLFRLERQGTCFLVKVELAKEN